MSFQRSDWRDLTEIKENNEVTSQSWSFTVFMLDWHETDFIQQLYQTLSVSVSVRVHLKDIGTDEYT